MTPQAWKPSHNPWLITFVVSLAAFMEVLDTSIANVALPHIAGSLSASYDEATWVLTSYLISNAVVLPISGYLVAVFGRKRFFMTCIALFSVSSLLCGIAPNLTLLLVFRVLQGAAGGGLQPMAQAVLADTFPPERRGLAFSMYGITAIIAPIVGPTLGGYLVDNQTWRWIFLLNVPVGAIALLLTHQLLEDPPYIKELKAGGIKLDYIGFGLLLLGVGALQVVLDKGQQEDWFASHLITILAVVAILSFAIMLVWEWFHEHPIIDLRLFKNINFSSACTMIFMLGVVYFSSIVLMPRFLQEQLGYTAEKAGMVLSSSALVLVVLLPIVGKLANAIQPRVLISAGWLALAVSMVISARWLNLALAFTSAQWLRVFQSLGLPFLFVPITMVAYVGLPPAKNNAAAGLLNFMRNIGSSVGTSLVTTLLARRAQFHQTHLVANVSEDNPAFIAALNGVARSLANAGLTTYEAHRQAFARVYLLVQSQAQTLAYLDVFWLLTIGAFLMFLVSLLLRKGPRGHAATPAH